MSKKKRSKKGIFDVGIGMGRHKDPRDDAIVRKYTRADRLRDLAPSSNPAAKNWI